MNKKVFHTLTNKRPVVQINVDLSDGRNWVHQNDERATLLIRQRIDKRIFDETAQGEVGSANRRVHKDRDFHTVW
jgi:hypothetical protein